MKTYIINLERSVERRKHIIAEAEKQGLDFEIVEAIEGGAVPTGEILKFADMEVVSRHPEWLTVRMLAGALSHRKACEKMLVDGVETALVLEDDVELFEEFAMIASSAASRLSGSEIALLHYVSFEPLGLSEHNLRFVEHGRKLMFPMTLVGVGSAAAYVITREAAKSITDKVIPLRTAPDGWNDFVSLGFVEKVRMVYPPAAGVVGAKSTIYLDSQSAFRTRLTEFLDKYRVPILYRFFRNHRLRNVAAMSRFYLTDERSKFDI